MDAMQHYFEYIMVCGCGIPKVKMTGTLEDWNLIREKAENMRKYDCEKWIDSLIPILDKLI
jgi:hypothetical protein